VPPGRGHAEIAQFQAGGISIEGLTIRAGEDVPAPAATVAAPAAAKPGKQP
jgi:AsmA protein